MSAIELQNFENQLELLSFTEQLSVMEYLAKLIKRNQKEQTYPFQAVAKKRQFGIAKGKFTYPQDFDEAFYFTGKADGLTFLTHDSLIPYYNEPCVFSV